MYCLGCFKNLKKDFNFYVVTQTSDDMAEFIKDYYASYIVLNDIENSFRNDHLELDCLEETWND